MSARYPSRGGESSQYKDDIYRVYFRDGEPSWVHARVIKSYPQLAKRVHEDPDEVWPLVVELKEFDHNIGHAIIHFLYTGTYRSYNNSGMDRAQKYQCELAEGLQVCVAASSLGLWPLHGHAEQETKSLCDKMSLQSIFDVIDDLRTALDQVETLAEYLENRMARAKFGAPGVSTKDVLRDLGSANTVSTLALRAVVLQHQRTMNEGKKKKNASAVDDHVSMHDQPQVPQTGAKLALQLMECELESLLVKKAKKGGKLVKSDRTRMKSLEVEIMRLRNLGHTKEISNNEEGPKNPAKGNTQASLIEVNERNRSEKVKLRGKKPADTSANKSKLKAHG
jgi:hypothetical protein